MTLNCNYRAGAFALSFALLASTGSYVEEAKAVETGELLIRSNCRNDPSLCVKIDKAKPVDPPAKPTPAQTERGIRDNGVKSHSGGMTSGRVATPPPVDDGATPPSAEYGVDRQILEKPPRETMRSAATGPGGGAGVDTPPSADYGVDGQIIDRGRDRPRVTERRAHSGPGGTPPSTAKGGKTGWLLGIGGLAAIIAVVAASSGGGTPVSR